MIDPNIVIAKDKRQTTSVFGANLSTAVRRRRPFSALLEGFAKPAFCP
jgi:hypothetical protein